MTIAVQRHVNLKSHNTMALNAVADYFAIAHSDTDIAEAVSYARSLQLPVCILGGGSNVIFAGDYAGLVLLIATQGITVFAESADDVVVTVAAGENWDAFLQYCIKQQWYGLENLAIIPGTVGAAPIQNIGAYGQEVASCIESVVVRNLSDWEEIILSASDCKFAYRDSIFKQRLYNTCVITRVNFRLSRIFTPNLSYKVLADALQYTDVINVETVRDAVIHIRQSKLPAPAELPNSGSFFKNPVVNAAQASVLIERYPSMPVYPQANGDVKIAAGWLIEQAGWKGKKLGEVGVYEKQALVLVNYAQATYADLQQLVKAVQSSVFAQFGILLEQEPLLISAQ
jgi:UDP-N-acetylmuramate dehydrogenase